MNHVQPLESRQLLSATLAGAAKPKPAPKSVIPNLIGKYTGTHTQQKPTHIGAESVIITIVTETKAGAISGTLVNPFNDLNHITGTVNAQDKVALKFVNENHATASLAGTYRPATHVLSGTYAVTAVKGHPAQSGVFSVALVK